jgi:hypothetical protein
MTPGEVPNGRPYEYQWSGVSGDATVDIARFAAEVDRGRVESGLLRDVWLGTVHLVPKRGVPPALSRLALDLGIQSS